jgi:hypothetical protein
MIFCSAVIEKSTTEEKWVIGEKSLQNEVQGGGEIEPTDPPISSTSAISSTLMDNTGQVISQNPSVSQPQKAHILWLQKRYGGIREGERMECGADKCLRKVTQ